MKKKLIKIMKPIHDEDEFLTLDDVPFLRNSFDAHNHFDTWLYWVNRVYQARKLNKLHAILECMSDEDKNSSEVWDAVKVCNLHFTYFDNPNEWFELPKKSVILIDECQQFFPPRAAGSRKPEAIAKLETHRHGGYDIHFITQHGGLTDQNIRKLVGRHIHFHNPFGGKRISRFENPKYFDPDNYHDKKQAKRKFTTHDVNFYGVYWSAEIHTHKFQFPKVLLLGLFAIVFIFLCVFYVFNMLQSKMNPDIVHVEQQSELVNSSQVVEQKNDYVEQGADKFLSEYLSELTTDVYISGSMALVDGKHATFDYIFYRSTDDAVFHPVDVGFTVEPISPCLAYLVISSVRKPVTCNPFYVRIPVDDSDNQIKDSFFASNANDI